MSIEELNSLEGEAAKIDQQIAPVAPKTEPEQPAQPAPTEAASIAALVQIMAGLFAPVFPSLQKIYTDTACQQIGDAAAPVMAKHGWTTGELLGKYAEELALLAVVAPLGLATWQGIQTDIAAATKKAYKQETPQTTAQVTAPAADQPQFAAPG